jgi:hypothetical protein
MKTISPFIVVITAIQEDCVAQDLARIMENLGNIAGPLRACYTEKDHPVFRAEEARGAVQRLIWALERQSEAATSGGQAEAARR